jgi:hypothetical protein
MSLLNKGSYPIYMSRTVFLLSTKVKLLEFRSVADSLDYRMHHAWR